MAYEQPVVHELGVVNAPALLIAGDQDRATIGRSRVCAKVRATVGLCTELAPRAVRELPNGELVMLAGVGHVAHLEAPERFHAEVLRFLQR
jgi:pimeloyl-ACP methyl ester carboxylesterase